LQLCSVWYVRMHSSHIDWRLGIGRWGGKDFLHWLAYQLIHNGGVQRRLRRRNADAIDNADEPPQVYFVIAVKFLLILFFFVFLSGSSVLPLKDLPAYLGLGPNMQAKRRCCMAGCIKQTAYYCATCSDVWK
jgi:hypothetical protein